MTPEQVEKVRDALATIKGMSRDVRGMSHIYDVASDGLRALAALNGEQEEWIVGESEANGIRIEGGAEGTVAKVFSMADARRIARLPALERAAREVIDADAKYGHMHDTLGDGDIRTGSAWDHMRNASCRLRTALTDKTERTYVYDHCFGTAVGEIDARIHYTVSGDPRDAAPEIEIARIETEHWEGVKAVWREISVAEYEAFSAMAETLDAELLAHAAETEAEFRNAAADARHDAARERQGE